MGVWFSIFAPSVDHSPSQDRISLALGGACEKGNARQFAICQIGVRAKKAPRFCPSTSSIQESSLGLAAKKADSSPRRPYSSDRSREMRRRSLSAFCSASRATAISHPFGGLRYDAVPSARRACRMVATEQSRAFANSSCVITSNRSSVALRKLIAILYPLRLTGASSVPYTGYIIKQGVANGLSEKKISGPNRSSRAIWALFGNPAEVETKTSHRLARVGGFLFMDVS